MPETPSLFQGELQPHQRDAVTFLDSHPKALLADEVGLGKTIEAIAHICSLRSRGELTPGRDRVFWVTASNLIEQTTAEFAKFAPALKVLAQTDLAFGQDTYSKRDRYAIEFPSGPDVLVVSHEQVSKAGDALWRRFGKPSLVVIDEVMALKSIEGKKHMAVREFTRLSPRVLAMTATPYEVHPFETFGVLRLIHAPGLWPENLFGSRFVEWSKPYVIPSTGKTIDPKPVGFVKQNLPELREYLGRFMLRRTARELSLPIPTKVGETDRIVEGTTAQQEAYESAAKVRGGVGHVQRTQAGRGSDGESALVEEFVHSLSTEFAAEKVIVYCETLSVLSILKAHLDGAGVGYRLIQGSTLPVARNKALAEFRDDPAVQVLIGSKVLEVGLNIQHARVLVTLDPADNPQRETQREGRIKRIGSPHQTYQHLTLWPDTQVAREKFARLARRRKDADLLLAPLPQAS